jgi:hypothetical protein
LAIAQNAPSSSGGAVTSYSVNPSLPQGLSLDITSGIITGTPNTTAALANYTVTASNSGGSTTVNLSITVNPPHNLVSTIAGVAGASGSADGTGSASRFNGPAGICVDGNGNLYVSDIWNHTIRKITPSGVVSTLAGLAGVSGSSDGIGAAARFNGPLGVAVDGVGNLYVADESNHSIRKITSLGVVTTLAGGVVGSSDGQGTAARFADPRGVAVDGVGNIYVTDGANNTIRKIIPSGYVSTLAGTSGISGSNDGIGIAASFNGPSGIVVDGSGNIFVSDNLTTIRKITPSGLVTTFAGTAGMKGSSNGTGSSANFNNLSLLALDSSGNIYVADTLNDTIRQVTPSAVVTTIAGMPGVVDSADGAGNAARFSWPLGVAVSGSGIIYVSDTRNYTIRKIIP